MSAVVIAVAVLAVWRLTHMVQDEEGPFGIFSRLQAWAASKDDKVGGVNHAFDCFFCLSMWVALPFAILMAGSLLVFILLWFGLSAGAILVNHVTEQ